MANKKKNVQNAGSWTEKKYSLLGTVGIAQHYLSVDFVLDIKSKIFGSKKLNDLEENELEILIFELRSEYVNRKKLHQRNSNKRKSV